MRIRPLKIISGGQTGADQGGLYAARELGIPTGGVAPQGWLTEDGPRQDILSGFGLSECTKSGYAARTQANVLASDGTLLVGEFQTGGSALTYQFARDAGKPIFHLEYSVVAQDSRVDEFRAWLHRHRIRTLNVAGNRESQARGIQKFTREFLVAAL